MRPSFHRRLKLNFVVVLKGQVTVEVLKEHDVVVVKSTIMNLVESWEESF